MYHVPVRSTTASTASAVLAIVAILSLLLSTFALAKPVLAVDGDSSVTLQTVVTDECQQATKAQLAGSTTDLPTGGFWADPLTSTWGATLIVPAGTCATVSLTSYTIDEVTGKKEPFASQAVHANLTETYQAGTHDLYIAVPEDCGWQVDLYMGGVDNEPPHDGDKLLSWSAWEPGYAEGWTGCNPPPECPGQGGELASYHYTVNGGVVTYLDLDLIPDLQGSELTTHFVIAEACEDIELSLDSNTAMGATWETSRPQDDYDSDTGLFDAGSHTMTVSVPDCFYQVDFVWGGLLTAAQINADTLYGDRKIDWRNGGDGECGGEEPDTSVLQVDKIICDAADSSTTFEGPIYVPILTEEIAVQGGDGELPADCEHGAGVTFTVLLDVNEDGVGEGPAVSPDLAADGSFTTDADGSATISLTVGSYILVEPATDGFPGGTLMFEIRADDHTLILVRNDVGTIGSLLIAKEDDEGEPLGGAGFTLDDDATAHLDTDEDGFVCIDDLELGGLYDISETVVPEGYEGGADQSDVEVTVDADCQTRTEDADATFVNIPEDVTTGGPPPNQPPREGTLGGNPPLPNTAMTPAPTSSVPAVVLALLMLTGLGAAAFVTRNEARRRR